MKWSDSFWWSSNVAEWVGAVGTVGALMFAGFQIRAERRSAHGAMSQTARSIEMSEYALKLQADRERRELAERERRQSARIACGTRHHPNALSGLNIGVSNYSDVPIYDLHWFVRTGDALARNPFDPPSLQPGKSLEVATGQPVNRAVLSGQFAGVTFRDNAGLHWLKWGDGVLLRGNSAELFELSPHDVILADDADPRRHAERAPE